MDNMEDFLAGWKPRGIRFEPPEPTALDAFAAKANKFPLAAHAAPGPVLNRHNWATIHPIRHKLLAGRALRTAIEGMSSGRATRPEDMNGLLDRREQTMYNQLIMLREPFGLTLTDMKVASQLLCFRERYFAARLFFNALNEGREL